MLHKPKELMLEKKLRNMVEKIQVKNIWKSKMPEDQ